MPPSRFLSSALAVLLSASLADAQNVRVKTRTTGPSRTGMNAQTGNIGGATLDGGATLTSPSLQTGIKVTPSPTLQEDAPASVETLQDTERGAELGSRILASPQAVTPAPKTDEELSPETVPGLSAPGGGKQGATQILDGAGKDIAKGSSLGAAGGEAAVQAALDRVFDASLSGAKTASGPSGVAGGYQQLSEQIAKTVALANAAPAGSAPGLYAAAMKTAEEKLPPAVAAQVKEAVASFAARKAEGALTELANAAYGAAAAGDAVAVQKTIKAMDQWNLLLGTAQAPFVANSARLAADIQRVLAEAQRKGAGKVSAPRIWFKAEDGRLTAILPTSSIVKLDSLAGGFALKDAPAPLAYEERAALAFSLRPTAANGARLVYGAHRAAGGSRWASAMSAAVYWLKAALGSLWARLRAFVLRLFGRGPGAGLTVGAPDLPKLEAALGGEQAFAGGWKLRSARGPDAGQAVRGVFSRFEAFGGERAAAEAVLAGSAPLDLAAARKLALRAKAMAQLLREISGDGSALAAVEGLTRRLEAEAGEGTFSARALLLVVGPGGLAHWVERMGRAADEAALSVAGSAPANALLSLEKGTARKRWALLDLGSGKTGLTPALRASVKLLHGTEKEPDGSWAVLGTRLWGRFAAGRLHADLRSTGAGGRVLLVLSEGSERLERGLGSLGFSIERRGSELHARLGADTAQLTTAELATALAAAWSLLQGGSAPSEPRSDAAAELDKLLAALGDRAAARKLAAVVQSLGPGLQRYETIGRVGLLEAQRTRLVLDDGRSLTLRVLRDPETGMAAFASAELDGAVVSAQSLSRLLRAP